MRLRQTTVTMANAHRLVGGDGTGQRGQQDGQARCISRSAPADRAKALAGEQVLAAAQDQRAAMTRLRRPHFIQRQPAGGDNAVIQFAIRLEAQQLAAEGETQVGRIFPVGCFQ